MIKIFTLCFLLGSSSIVFSQSLIKDDKILLVPPIEKLLQRNKGCGITDTLSRKVASQSTTVGFRCGASINDIAPLWIVDGLPLENFSFQTINPGDIESIEILKNKTAISIFGCQASGGVVIITTKGSTIRRFNVKDFLDGSKIAGATVTLIPLNGRENPIVSVANDSGSVLTNKLKLGEAYSVIITSTGYKEFRTLFNNRNKQVDFLLERNYRENDPVVVTGTYCTRRIGCGGHFTNISKCKMEKDTVFSQSRYEGKNQIRLLQNYNMYPNPVRRGEQIIISMEGLANVQLKMRVLDGRGVQLSGNSFQVIKGMNQLTLETDMKWTAGIYFIQFIDENGGLVETKSLAVQ